MGRGILGKSLAATLLGAVVATVVCAGWGMASGSGAPVSLLCAAATAAAGAPATPADWPHWRGPSRDDATPEGSGYDAGAWPPGQPLWVRALGVSGESTPVVAGGRLYTLGYRQGSDVLSCLDAASGRPLWAQSYRAPAHGRNAVRDQGAYAPGPISTPEYDAQTGYLYTLSCDGDLNCWDTAKAGARVWGFNLYDRFHAPQRPNTGGGLRDYGYTTSPLVWGPWVIVEVGSAQGNLMAFDKRTGGTPPGRPAWCSENSDPAGHAGGLVPMVVQGVPCVAVLNVNGLLVARLDKGHEGKTVATFPYRPRCAATIVTPAVWGNRVILSTHFGPGDALVEVTLGGATRVGQAPHSEVGTPIFHEGRAYKASGRLECWDLSGAESKLLWQGENYGSGGNLILTGDGKLVVFGAGRLALYTLAGQKLSEKRDLPSGWQHVLLAGSRLYWKDNAGSVTCYALAAGTAPGR